MGASTGILFALGPKIQTRLYAPTYEGYQWPSPWLVRLINDLDVLYGTEFMLPVRQIAAGYRIRDPAASFAPNNGCPGLLLLQDPDDLLLRVPRPLHSSVPLWPGLYLLMADFSGITSNLTKLFHAFVRASSGGLIF